ncbi:MAG: NAD(P)-dependent oxidoreductase [Muribaculaceae bacterium]|nr:NAD(P)-dependent oxidoreductase [Muribaculaceae bacterium]
MERILITGSSGMLGRYLKEQFDNGFDIFSLGRNPGNSFRCDLSAQTPEFGDNHFDTIIHAAGTEDPLLAMALNYEGTRRLTDALHNNPPCNFVYISSYRVYSRDAGENVGEESNLWASDETGRSKALTEKHLSDWAGKSGVNLTIIRPARMFGNGVSGETLSLFNDAVKGYYVHIRDNDARISIVTAFDVARGIRILYHRGGVFNAADGTNPRLIELVEAMTANAGAKKRMTHLPVSWAEWCWRLAFWIPSVRRNLSPQVVEARMKTLTLDGSNFERAAGISYFDTLSVIERTNKDYPYSS